MDKNPKNAPKDISITLSESDLEKIASQQTRRKILEYLLIVPEDYCSGIKTKTFLRFATIHEHLQMLVLAGMVKREERKARQGVEIYYSITDLGKERLKKMKDAEKQDKDKVLQ
jgi:DNA-binding MarR family transcriptional regulator